MATCGAATSCGLLIPVTSKPCLLTLRLTVGTVEDLAMLDLFGMSYLTDILEGYQSAHPLKAGWQDRITLWQLYPIAGHCVFFGGGYVSQYRAMCRSLLK